MNTEKPEGTTQEEWDNYLRFVFGMPYTQPVTQMPDIDDLPPGVNREEVLTTEPLPVIADLNEGSGLVHVMERGEVTAIVNTESGVVVELNSNGVEVHRLAQGMSLELTHLYDYGDIEEDEEPEPNTLTASLFPDDPEVVH